MKVAVLAGPTASGKTGLALRLAADVPLEVISADASMVYRGMDIGTAKPSPAEQLQVPHHLIDVVEPSQTFSVSEYLQMAEQAIGQVLDRGKLPLVVGGTGYYIRALSEGLYDLPEPDFKLQNQLWQTVEKQGLDALIAELEAVSPQDVERCQRNPRRVVRAVELLRRTGVPPAKVAKILPRFQYRKLILWPDWAWLEPRLAQRIEAMFSLGLVGEVAELLTRYSSMPTALQSIGYKEVAGYLHGQYSLEQAKSDMLKATRAYAKRQFTWLKKEPGDVSVLNCGGDAALDGLLEWFWQN